MYIRSTLNTENKDCHLCINNLPWALWALWRKLLPPSSAGPWCWNHPLCLFIWTRTTLCQQQFNVTQRRNSALSLVHKKGWFLLFSSLSSYFTYVYCLNCLLHMDATVSAAFGSFSVLPCGRDLKPGLQKPLCFSSLDPVTLQAPHCCIPDSFCPEGSGLSVPLWGLDTVVFSSLVWSAACRRLTVRAQTSEFNLQNDAMIPPACGLRIML